MKFTAVVVTRGDVDLGPVIESIQAADPDEIIIRKGWAGVYERWDAAAMAKHPLVYVQDDDCIVDVRKVIYEYDPNRPGLVHCNMPREHQLQYFSQDGQPLKDGIALVGFGCVFSRDRVSVFSQYLRHFVLDDVTRSEADRIFTALNAVRLIDVGVHHREFCSRDDRMWKRPNHGAMLKEVRRRIRIVKEEE